jgi:hypothetical protein
MRPAIIYLLGYPGAGKYTIAKALAALADTRGVPVRVVDNHHINNVVFEVIDVDGIGPVKPRTWSLIGDVRTAVLAAVEELGPPEWTYVFTNVLIAGDKGDEAILDRLATLAATRDSSFVPVRLHCELEELARRVVAPSRSERMKWVDADGLRAFVARLDLVDVSVHPHALDLDVTTLSAADAAEAILDYAQRL